MTILVWLILGLIAGWVASRLMGSGGYGLIGDIVIGIIGAVLGGWLGPMLLGGDVDVTGLNFTSIALSIGGAVIVIAVVRALAPGRRSGV